MRLQKRTPALALGMAIVWCVLPISIAQTLSLSGKVTDTATHPVPSAKVLARRVVGGKIYTAKTNGDGLYTIPDLAAGDYQVWAIAGELRAEPVKVTLAAAETTDLVVSPALHHH
jgi:hypothetical protein